MSRIDDLDKITSLRPACSTDDLENYRQAYDSVRSALIALESAQPEAGQIADTIFRVLGVGAFFKPDIINIIAPALARAHIKQEAKIENLEKDRIEFIVAHEADAQTIAELRKALAEWEMFRETFGGITYHSEGMGCGIEDRGITDRYVACEHGWDSAMNRVAEQMPEARP
jgi:hypothetical protein